MPSLSFSAQIDSWVNETRQRQTAVFRQSSQEVAAIAQDLISNNMVGVVTGYLRASLRGSLSRMPSIIPDSGPVEGRSYGANNEYALTVASAEIGDTIYLGYTAGYARFVHDGTSRMRGRPWVSLAALHWQRVVDDVTRRAKARAAA